MPVSVRIVESVREVEPGLIEPEVVPLVPEFIEPEVEPVVPEFIEFVLPDVPVPLVVALPDGVAFGFAVEPVFVEPLLFWTPGPEVVELSEVDVPPVVPVAPAEPLVPVLPDVPLVWANETAVTAPMAIAAAMESVREVDMRECLSGGGEGRRRSLVEEVALGRKTGRQARGEPRGLPEARVRYYLLSRLPCDEPLSPPPCDDPLSLPPCCLFLPLWSCWLPPDEPPRPEPPEPPEPPPPWPD
jgi:hypothetical protein